MARLEGAYEQVSRRLTNIDPRFDALDRKIDLRFDALDNKIDLVEARLDEKIELFRDTLDEKIDQRLMWTVGVIVATWLTTIAAIELHH